MALYTCTKCGKKVPMQYEVCPFCQTPRPKLNTQTQSASKKKQKKKKSKKPLFKRWWFWLIVVFLVIGSIGNMGKGKDDDKPGDKGTVSQSEPEQDASSKSDNSSDSSTSEPDKSEESDKPGPCTLPSGFEITLFYSTVRNDVTGNWRLSASSSSIPVSDCALEYYNAMFTSDDEIHAVWNATLGTTTSIKAMPGLLFVDTFEYVDGEEHDAKLLFSGMLLDSRVIDIKTGDPVTFDDEDVETASLDKTLPQEAATTVVAGVEKIETAQNPGPKKEENKSPTNSNDRGLKVAGTTSSQPSVPKSSGGGNENASNFNTYDNSAQQDTEDKWVLNTSSKKIHYPSCREVKKIAPQNYSTSNLSESELKEQGYTTCGVCHQ